MSGFSAFVSGLGSDLGSLGSDIWSGIGSLGSDIGSLFDTTGAGAAGAAASGAPSAASLLSAPSMASSGVSIAPEAGGAAAIAPLGAGQSALSVMPQLAQGAGNFGFQIAPSTLASFDLGAGNAAAAGADLAPGVTGSSLSAAVAPVGGAGAVPSAAALLGYPATMAPAGGTVAGGGVGLGGGGNAIAAPLSQGGYLSAAPAAAAGSGGTGIGGLLESVLKDPKMLMSLAGLGASIFTRPSLPSATGQEAQTAQQAQATANQLQAQAAPLESQAQGLISSATTGQLPAGAQALIDQQQKAAEAQIRSTYAGLGLTGSQSEGSDLATSMQQKAAMEYQMAQQATQTGMSVQQLANQMTSTALGAIGGAGSVYGNIAGIQLAQDQGLSQALANFASSAALGAGYAAQGKPQQQPNAAGAVIG